MLDRSDCFAELMVSHLSAETATQTKDLERLQGRLILEHIQAIQLR